MKTHFQTKRLRHGTIGHLLRGSLIVITAALVLFGGTLHSSAGSPQVGTPAAPKVTATPGGPKLMEREATLTIADCVLKSEGIPADQLSMEVLPATLWKWQHGTQQLHAIHFADMERGWAVGNWGFIVHTEDGGQTWERQESGVANWLGDVQFVDANRGWAVGSSGTILHTSDGGLSWNVQDSPLNVDLRVLSFVDSQNGWIGLPDGVLRTTDGGDTWAKTGTGVAAQVRDMQFFDANEGVIISNSGGVSGGPILLTSDGGATWTTTSCGYSGPCRSHFLALHFPNRTFGVAVGGWVGPYIYLTNNGGTSL